VLVSTDQGKHWDSLKATDAHYCAYTDTYCYENTSKGWMTEQADLSSYAGKTIRLRFEYLVDGGLQTNGMLVDDISIPAIGFSDNVESGDNGWTHVGFMRVNNTVPQHWAVNIVTRETLPHVIPMILDAANTGKVMFTAPSDGAVIDVAAMAPFVKGAGNFTITIKGP
jgi:hypothetical protein